MTAPTFRVIHDEPADRVWVTAAGDLDMSVSPELDAILATAIRAAPRGAIVVDLAGVTFLDCGGLGPLLRARHALGDRFLLANVSEPVQLLLGLTDLGTAFAVASPSWG